MIDAVLFSVMENEEQRSELEEFYLKYKERLCWIAFSRLKDTADAEDAVQTVFSEIAGNPDNFFDIPPDKRLAYIDVMVRNIAIDMYNKKNKISVEDIDGELEEGENYFENDIPEKILVDEVKAFMKQLPETQQIVLQLYYFFGLTRYEISQRLKISLTTVNKRLKTALGAIREHFDEGSAKYE